MTFLLTFHTHFDANAFMRFAKQKGKAKMKPVPRKLSSSCGTCVEFSPAEADFKAESLSGLEYEGLYLVRDNEFELLDYRE